MMKESIHQEDVTVLNVHVPNKEYLLHKAKTDNIEKRNRKIHNYS